MKKFWICLALGVAGVFGAAAQENVDVAGKEAVEELQSCVAEFGAKLPLAYNDGWTVQSLTLAGDEVKCLIKLEGETAKLMPMVALNKSMLKGAWLANMKSYGDVWNELVRLTSGANMNFNLLVTDGASEPVSIVFTPADFGASDK